MRVINIFPETRQWSDIVRMIFSLDGQLEESVIISRDLIPLPPEVNRARFILSPPGLRGVRFFYWAAKTARDVIAASPPMTRWAVMEHSVGLACFFLKYLLRVRVRTAVFFMFPVTKFFLERGWNHDRWAKPLAFRQRMFYFLDYTQRSLVALASLAGADWIVANSPEILASYGKLKPRAPRLFLPNSVTPVAMPREQTAAEANEFVIIFIALMQPHKGVASALEIFARFQRSRPEARLLLVGDCFPADLPWLQGLIAQYEHQCGVSIPYRGKLAFEELWAVYSSAHVFLFPTYWEGSPRVVQEALQYGCPVVTTDIPGNRVIDPLGKCVQFFPPGDADAALAILLRLADSPAELARLRKASMESMRAGFSVQTVGQVLFDLYHRMIQPDQPSALTTRGDTA